MDWVLAHCDCLRTKLQNVLDGGAAGSAREFGARRGLRVPWSWACRSIIETVTRYPSGLTEAVVLAELELLWRRDVRGAFVPGKLRAYLDAQYAPLSDVIQTSVVRHSDQLVTLVEDHAGSVSNGQSPATVDMYLHQNFKSCLHYLQHAGHDLLAPGRKVRLTGVRMITGATVSASRGGGGRGSPDADRSTLLLTEYLAFVLDHRRSDDFGLAAGAFGQTRVRDTFNENANHDPFFVICKVVEIRRPRQHQDRAGGPAQKRRLTVQSVVLECAGRRDREGAGASFDGGGDGGNARGDGADGEKDIAVLNLWDEQMCLASLFKKGDGLAIYWPWVVQSDGLDVPGGRPGLSQQPVGLASQIVAASSQAPAPRFTGWHYEYGSATALFVLPRESRGPLFAAANGNGAADGMPATAGDETSRASPQGGFAGAARADEMPVDENGVRDLLQFSRRLSVADLAPNMSNVSVYGQVVSVCVPAEPLPAVLPSRPGSSSANQGSLSQPLSRQLARQPPTRAGGVRAVEIVIGDSRGEARVLCCGREAALDALRCRPGHFVLACGLRTFAPAFPSLASQAGDDVVILCGEPDETGEAAAAGDGVLDARAGGQRGGRGGNGICRMLNASCLEGLLHCPFMSRHTLLHSQQRAAQPVATFACKAAVTWARWAFAGDGLWVVHRRCGARLPCHHGALGASAADSARKMSRKRAREVRDPGSVRTQGVRETPVTCPLCKSSVSVGCAEQAELSYAPLLLALDDGSRCIVAECRGEIVTAALGGIHAHVFLQMGNGERKATLASLIGRELRCVVGGTGPGRQRDCPWEEGEGGMGLGDSGGRVEHRVERIAGANPAADLAQLLS